MSQVGKERQCSGAWRDQAEWPEHVEIVAEMGNARIYDHGDVCLQPSRWEGIGLQLLECPGNVARCLVRFTQIDNKLTVIDDKVTKIDASLSGNEKPGLEIRLDCLEQTEKRRQWQIRGIWTAAIAAIISTLVSWLWGS